MSFDFIKDKDKKIYFIGIGGISMSGLAEILIKKGFAVYGSDIKTSPITDKLKSLGAKINIGQFKENITSDINLIVYTAAISKENPEIIRAKELNIPLMTRGSFLGHIMKGHKYNVAIAGTHGKTTTTSMLSSISLNANLDPTILVGGELDSIGGNVRVGHSEYFITEACEYKGSFLEFYPYVGVILNIDADHLDYYKDIYDIQNAFIKFAKLIPKDGYLVCCSDDEKMEKVMKSVDCNILTYGLKSGEITAKNISYDTNGCASFDVYRKNTLVTSVKLNVPGKHNILNSLASTASALILNIPSEKISEGLCNFKGAHRRFEIKGKKNGVTVIDDYAHHPTEIKATLSAANNYPHKRICCVFQPHTFSRTLSLYDDFVKAFDNVDELILADIYAAREKDTHKVSSAMLAESISKRGINCKNINNFKDIVSYLNDTLKDGDIFFTIGAGDVFKVGEMYLEK
ncbi:UDP-N-acetylmuramate--alanine ligase [Clostridium algifaecis]|uniref:UDP-N-acetylmuramate--L-alanine ligase n=1 Tax=Clostridium algifaecis TaxID=1472040 RepID=A0ABS4KV81_9CLOT|nr:UDP-N-acetylmuramate--L-alanine ligase [Clostridium algifaecis]MBP2033946.1 UDP-N-acetylmuramate--alanine ligase [Clostridium algifaecis]